MFVFLVDFVVAFGFFVDLVDSFWMVLVDFAGPKTDVKILTNALS